MACNDLQVMEEVLDALTESVQKQQRAKEEMQKRFHEEASQPGCQKQRRKELAERLQVEDAKLDRKQQNLREVQSLQESWQGMDLSYSPTQPLQDGRRKDSTVLCSAWYAQGCI